MPFPFVYEYEYSPHLNPHLRTGLDPNQKRRRGRVELQQLTARPSAMLWTCAMCVASACVASAARDRGGRQRPGEHSVGARARARARARAWRGGRDGRHQERPARRERQDALAPRDPRSHGAAAPSARRQPGRLRRGRQQVLRARRAVCSSLHAPALSLCAAQTGSLLM